MLMTRTLGASRWRSALVMALVATAGVIVACGGAVAPDIDAGTGTGTGAGSDGGADATTRGADGSTQGDGGASTRDGGAPGPGASDPGVVGCGVEKCAVSGGEPGTPNASYCCVESTGSKCRPEAASACSGDRYLCDEAADCKGGDVCCIEGPVVRGGQKSVTMCRPTCITGAPRYQVCKTDAECESGEPCKAYDCGGRLAGLRFCFPPDGCK